MYLRPFLIARFSSSLAFLKMDASVIVRNSLPTPSSLLGSFTPPLTPHQESHRPFLIVAHQFRRKNSLRRLCVSSEPPFSQLRLKVVSDKEIDKDNCASTSTPTVSNLVSLEKETTGEEAKDESITIVNPVVSSMDDLERKSVEASKGEVGTSASTEQGLMEQVSKELKTTSTLSSNDVTFKNMDLNLQGGQRKRKAIVAKPPKRLYTDEEDLGFMQEALKEAKKAAKLGEVPVGAVLVHKNKIIARFHNEVETTGDPTAHAEMLCIRCAAAQLGGWRLTDVTLYVTLEPCPMCAGAILQGRVSEVVWGARNSLLGADGSWIKLFPVSSSGEQEPKCKDYLHPFHRTITVRRGVLGEECGDIMQTFFAMRRQQPKCRTDDPQIGIKFGLWPRSPTWSPLAFKRLNSWVRRWFQF